MPGSRAGVTPLRLSSRPEAAAVVAAAAVLAWNLGGGSLASSDDAVYARAAREMARAGHWLLPTWLGEPLFDKPPLLFWLLRLSGGLLGWGEAAMRLPGVFGAVVALGYLVGVVREAVGRAPTARWAGPLAVGLTVASTAFTMNVRRPLTDPLLCAAVLAGLFHAARLLRRPARGDAVALGIAGGLGVLAKWVAVAPFALVALVALGRRRRWRALALGAGVALAVAAPWHVAVTIRHGEAFWTSYLGYHVLARAAEPLVGETSPLYYVRAAWSRDGALALVLGGGLIGGTAVSLRARDGGRRALALVVGAAWLQLLVLHVAGTRLYHYLVPAVPLAAAAAAAAIARLPSRGRALAAGGVAAIAVASFATGPLHPHLTRPDYAPGAEHLGRGPLADLPPEATLVVWEDYDPALIWYADHPARIWTQHERFWSLQQSVAMMRRAEAVVRAEEEAMEELIRRRGPVIVVAPLARDEGLEPWIRRARQRRRVDDRRYPEHGRRVVRLGAEP